jgi:uncharacterized protein (DUF362 family)
VKTWKDQEYYNNLINWKVRFMCNANSTVAVVKSPDVRFSIAEVIKLLGGIEKFVKPNDFVFIKPNIVAFPPPGRPPTDLITDPQLVASLVEHCFRAGARKVAVGDGPGLGFPSRLVYEQVGYEKPIRDAGGEMAYFDEEPLVNVEVPGGHVLHEIRVPKIVNEADVLLNVPKMKTNSMGGGVTLGIKNLFGIPPFDDRPPWHRWPELHYMLVDLVRLFRPALTVIDGLVAMEGRGPIAGPSIRMDLVIAGSDVVSVDSVGASIMGFEPFEIPSIQVAQKQEIGVAELDRIQILGTPINEVQKRFFRSIGPIVHPAPNVKVYPGGACYGCAVWIATVPNPLAINPNLKYVLITGQTPRVPDELEADEVWVLGNCAASYVKKLRKLECEIHFVPGCPPHAWVAENILKPIRTGSKQEMEKLYKR